MQYLCTIKLRADVTSQVLRGELSRDSDGISRALPILTRKNCLKMSECDVRQQWRQSYISRHCLDPKRKKTVCFLLQLRKKIHRWRSRQPRSKFIRYWHSFMVFEWSYMTNFWRATNKKMAGVDGAEFESIATSTSLDSVFKSTQMFDAVSPYSCCITFRRTTNKKK